MFTSDLVTPWLFLIYIILPVKIRFLIKKEIGTSVLKGHFVYNLKYYDPKLYDWSAHKWLNAVIYFCRPAWELCLLVQTLLVYTTNREGFTCFYCGTDWEICHDGAIRKIKILMGGNEKRSFLTAEIATSECRVETKREQHENKKTKSIV